MLAIDKTDLALQPLLLKKAAKVLRAINHDLRKQILFVLFQEGNLTVTELYIKLSLEQSFTSQQLTVLRKGGFVRTQRQGKNIYYSINAERVEQVQEVIKPLIERQ